MTDAAPHRCPACGFDLAPGRPGAPVDLGALGDGLPPRLRRLLRALCTRWGRIVDHADLSAAIWPAGDPALTRAGIRVRICELRRALAAAGVDAAIVTWSTAGYQIRRKTS